MGQLPPTRRASVRQARSQSQKNGKLWHQFKENLKSNVWQFIAFIVGLPVAALTIFSSIPELIKAFSLIMLAIIILGVVFVSSLYQIRAKFLATCATFCLIGAVVLSSWIMYPYFAHSSSNRSNASGPGETLYTYRGHHSSIKSLVWSSDGKRITSYSTASKAEHFPVQTWDATSGNNPVVRKYYDRTLGADVTETPSPDGKLVASLSILPAPPYSGIRGEERAIRIFNATTGDLIQARDISGDIDINQLVWSPDNKSGLIASSVKGIVSVWNASTGKNVRVYMVNDPLLTTPTRNFVYGLAWSPDGRFIASSDADGAIQIWEVATGELYTKYPSHCPGYEGDSHGFAYNIDWQADGPGTSRMTLGCSDDGYEHDEIIKILSVAIDYYASRDQFFSIEEVSQASLCHMDKIDEHKGPLNHVTWDLSPDDKYIVYTCRDSSMISIWDIAHIRDVLMYKGHHDAVTTLAWSPNGQYIASGSKDETVQVWWAV